MDCNAPIGVMDTGVGGLTVASQLRRLLPCEDIVYFGDSVNCPYGNRSREEIVSLSRGMLSFLQGRGVKIVAIACNTISALADILSPSYPFPIVGIIAPAAAAVVRDGLKQVGVLATEFTVSTRSYDKLVHALDPSVEVVGKGSPLLAGLVDSGDFQQGAIDAEITLQVDNILSRADVGHIILGCTHYPIVMDHFARLYPDITFINPAIEQARAVRGHLAAHGGLKPSGCGSLSIFTTGTPGVYLDVAARLGLDKPQHIEQAKL